MKTVTRIGIDFIEPEPDYTQNLFVRTREKHLTAHSLFLRTKNRTYEQQEEGNAIIQDMINEVDELYRWFIPAKFWTM